MSRNDSVIRLFSSLILAALVAVPVNAFAQDSERISLDPISLDGDESGNQVATEDESEAVESSDDDVDDESNEDVADKSATKGDSVVKGHGFQLAMSFVGVPGYILDNWFSEHGNVWQNGAVNMGFSLDYFLRFNAPCEMRFGLSWVNARTGDAYWLDKNYSDKPRLADYVVNNFSIVSLEVTAYHIIPIIEQIAFYYGGGLWGGIILDDAKSYAIRSRCAESVDDISQCPHEPGSIPLTQMPKGFGFVVVTLGFKFTLWNMMTIRAEGGFKGYFYGQLGLGVEF